MELEPKPFSILTVEKDIDLQNLMGLFLGELGFREEQLLFASNPVEAKIKLEQAKEKNRLPDLIFLNLIYGLDETFTFLTELKKDESVYKEIPTVILSGDSRPEVEEACLNSGAHGFLRKPFEFDLEKIKNIIHKIQGEKQF